jgi:hypothetical protein
MICSGWFQIPGAIVADNLLISTSRNANRVFTSGRV